ncbi:MAG: ribosomal-processing cysteine protease Prp [Thermoanaerobacteraceae bacterium]|jgi:hypothetical protein|nr:ribosomal-processing cysteine protease Prp [Thermoanaerobacteraceae bacterium]
MIKAKFFRDNNDAVYKFEIKGHAGYDEYGKDIVCAAVAAVTQTAVLGIENLPTVEISKKIHDGNMVVYVKNNGDARDSIKVTAIIETMILGLKDIERVYPEYIKISDRRC